MINAMIIDQKDNVAVAIEPIEKGGTVCYKENGEDESFTALDNITIYHKLAVKDISKGEKIVKYGEHIGEAKVDIKKGEYVHVQNVESVREDLGGEK